MRLLHSLKWNHEDVAWQTSVFSVYNGPAETKGRWNEVLLPAGRKHMDEMLMEGRDVFAGEGGPDGME